MYIRRKGRTSHPVYVLGSALVALSLWTAASWWRAPRERHRTDQALPEAGVEAQALSRPNIVLVVYDARRRDDFSFGRHGNRRGDTPFLAELADRAVYFENAIAPGCWTAPVHAAMFTGRTVCELGIDYYNPGHLVFSPSVQSLAEILGAAGYQTVAYADHPFFFHGDQSVSLVRGFGKFSVIAEFAHYSSDTNVGTVGGAVERRTTLTGMPGMSVAELETEISRFNAGELHFDLEVDGDYDQKLDLYIAKLPDLYADSEYFAKRYRSDFDEFVFGAENQPPFFLFFNLHMCTIANPDADLFDRWRLKTLMLNAQRLSAQLRQPKAGETVRRCLNRNSRLLKLRHGFKKPITFLKHVYDNRFYDATFQAIWRYLEQRGLLGNTVVIATSDHGMSFEEHGEKFYLHGGARPYEYITRVPLVLRFPDGSAESAMHRQYNQQVLLTDLFATIVELGAGFDAVTSAGPTRGVSLLRRLRDGRFESTVSAECSLRPYAHRFRSGLTGYAKAIYADGYKLIHSPQPRQVGQEHPLDRRLETSAAASGAGSPAEPLTLLFDLSLDPFERVDMSMQRPDVVERLRGFADNWDCRPEQTPPASAPDWDPETIETLRALGYVE